MDEFRNKIDDVDNKIMNLLLNRLSIVKEIGQYKKQHNIPILDKNREDAIFNKIENNFLSEDQEYLKNIYQKIMAESKNNQKLV